MSRGRAEFSQRIKDEEFTRFHKKNPDKKEVELEIHHILNVSEGRKRGVPDDALRSQINAVAVEKDFHRKIHKEQDEETQEELANWFLRVWRSMFG